MTTPPHSVFKRHRRGHLIAVTGLNRRKKILMLSSLNNTHLGRGGGEGRMQEGVTRSGGVPPSRVVSHDGRRSSLRKKIETAANDELVQVEEFQHAVMLPGHIPAFCPTAESPHGFEPKQGVAIPLPACLLLSAYWSTVEEQVFEWTGGAVGELTFRGTI
ncbi:uncharacterized protein AB9W97_012939 isoform 1-T3 [Spinachia spinachia]